MNFTKRVEGYLTEKVGHQRLAGRLTKDVGKEISASQVAKYLKKLDRKKVTAAIKRRAQKATDEGAYKWGTIYKILVNHFRA